MRLNTNTPMQQFKDIATKLLEVTIERNFDMVNKGWESRIFLKLYLSIRTSGLLGAISDKDLKTLITLATFMDEQGKCYPSQEYLAKSLKLTQAGIAKRMKSLLAFRWQGKPLVSAQKTRSNGGRYENTIYTILPESSLSIFSNTPNSHMPASHMVGSNTNDNHVNNNNNVTDERNYYLPRYRSAGNPMANELARDMNDIKNLAYYTHVVNTINPGILLRARGEVLEEKKINKTRGAMFAYLVKKYVAQSVAPSSV